MFDLINTFIFIYNSSYIFLLQFFFELIKWMKIRVSLLIWLNFFLQFWFERNLLEWVRERGEKELFLLLNVLQISICLKFKLFIINAVEVAVWLLFICSYFFCFLVECWFNKFQKFYIDNKNNSMYPIKLLLVILVENVIYQMANQYMRVMSFSLQ